MSRRHSGSSAFASGDGVGKIDEPAGRSKSKAAPLRSKSQPAAGSEKRSSSMSSQPPAPWMSSPLSPLSSVQPERLFSRSGATSCRDSLHLPADELSSSPEPKNFLGCVATNRNDPITDQMVDDQMNRSKLNESISQIFERSSGDYRFK